MESAESFWVFVNNLSPILVDFGPLEVRWYGLMHALGIIFCYGMLFWIFKREKYDLKNLDSLILSLFLGLLIGARLGQVFFYEPARYLANPLEIFKIWEGGLASHGAAIGILVAYSLWCWFKKIKFSKYINAMIVPFPFYAGLVRIGNYFNSEIVGYPTEGNYGVIFARLGEDFPRHPVQLYSALMNFIVFAVIFYVYKKYYKKMPPMSLMFLYVFLYFVGRFIVEIWKDLKGFSGDFPLSIGQVLSLGPILIALIYFIFFMPRQRRNK